MIRRKNEGIKIFLGCIFGLVLIVAIVWACVFVTDYIMFNMNKPIIFSVTKIEDVEGKHFIYEKGLGYFVKIYEEESSEFFLFGNKIKNK